VGERARWANRRRFEACSDSRARWFANAGGFYLDASSMCVRLLVKFGKRTTIVRTGIRTGCE
jgi:hypothetical protein